MILNLDRGVRIDYFEASKAEIFFLVRCAACMLSQQ